jgi:hypothetical protein
MIAPGDVQEEIIADLFPSRGSIELAMHTIILLVALMLLVNCILAATFVVLAITMAMLKFIVTVCFTDPDERSGATAIVGSIVAGTFVVSLFLLLIYHVEGTKTTQTQCTIERLEIRSGPRNFLSVDGLMNYRLVATVSYMTKGAGVRNSELTSRWLKLSRHSEAPQLSKLSHVRIIALIVV